MGSLDMAAHNAGRRSRAIGVAAQLTASPYETAIHGLFDHIAPHRACLPSFSSWATALRNRMIIIIAGLTGVSVHWRRAAAMKTPPRTPRGRTTEIRAFSADSKHVTPRWQGRHIFCIFSQREARKQRRARRQAAVRLAPAIAVAFVRTKKENEAIIRLARTHSS